MDFSGPGSGPIGFSPWITDTETVTYSALGVGLIRAYGTATSSTPFQIFRIPKNASTRTVNGSCCFMFHCYVHASNLKEIIIRWS